MCLSVLRTLQYLTDSLSSKLLISTRMQSRWLSVTSLFVFCLPVCLSVDVEDVLQCRPVTMCCMSMRTDSLPNLDLTFNCSQPDNATIRVPPGTNHTAAFRLFYSYPCITSLPHNICRFPNIASIQLVNGEIQALPSLSCLKNLIALDMSGNKITSLKKDTFVGLERLRYINLRSNQISSIEPKTFTEDLHGLMVVLLDGNRLQTVEAAWQMSIRHEFCYFGLSWNQITHFSNEENWHMDLDAEYGPGFVDYRHNRFTTWFTDQLKMYGIKDIKDILAKLLPWGFDFRGNQWRCDCKMHEYLHIASTYLKIMKRGIYEAFCQSPPNLSGRRLVNVSLDQLVCNITEKCPQGCFCQDQPENGYVLVECKPGSLKNLPSDLPEGKLNLNLANNRIKRLVSRNYLERTIYIDVSGNDLEYIEPEAIFKLQRHAKMINMSDNKLSDLPEEIQNIPFSSLSLEDNPLVCDCKSSWMYTWISQQDKGVSRVTCYDTAGNNVKVLQVHPDTLHCSKISPFPTAFSVLLGTLAVIFHVGLALLVIFRYETSIIFHSTLKQFQNSKQELAYDVFISLEEECNMDRIWVIKTLLPQLETNGLKVYFPPRDMDPGSVTLDEVIKTLRKSHTALVVLSNGYINNTAKMSEFNTAYSIMVRQRRGRLIIVRSSEVTSGCQGYLRGFFRLKKFLDRDSKDLMEKILAEVHRETACK